MMFKKLNQRSVYKDKWFELFQDEVEFPDGSKGTYAWTRRKNGVAVVVVTPDKQLLLHREYRYVIQNYSWEIQGGGIDQTETPEQAAIRELKEESGILVSLDMLTKFGVFYPLHSFNTEKVTLFMVKVDQTNVTTQGNEISESINQQQFVSFEKALSMIDTGEINDALTANAIQIAIRKVE